MIRRVPSLALVVLLLVPPAFAQQQMPAATESIDVAIVNVDVFVTDRKGRRVRGLTRDDFELRENGKPQPITNFAEYAPATKQQDASRTAIATTPAQPASSETTATAPTPAPNTPRTIVIFVDLVPQPSKRVREVFDALRSFVRNAVRPGDAVSVVAYAVRASVRQSFTDDIPALEAALTELEKQSIGLIPLAVDIEKAIAADQEAAMAMARFGKPIRGTLLSTADLERKANEIQTLVVMRRKTAAITSMLESMSGAEGRKMMILALHQYGLNPGYSALASTTRPLFLKDPMVDRLRQAIMRTANANGVTLYPIHPPGVSMHSQITALEDRPDVFAMDSDQDIFRSGAAQTSALNQTFSLQEIAQKTGGLMASGPSAIADLMPRVVDDLESYYSLAYRVSAKETDVERKVVVTTKDRSYRVRARRTVVEKSDDVQMHDRVIANLFQPIEHSVIPVRVKLGAMTKSKDLYSLPVTIYVPRAAFTALPDGDRVQGSFTLFVATGGEFGVMSDVQRRTQPFSFKVSEVEAAGNRELTYSTTVEYNRFSDVLSIGVRDDITREYGLLSVALPVPASASE